MGIILDTSFLVAFNIANDINHETAQLLKFKIKSKEFGQSYISDYIFDEFATFLKARHVPLAKIYEIGDALLSDETIKLLRIDESVFLQAWVLFKKYQKLSFTDCTTVVLCKEFNIGNIASFDSDFEGIHFIKRIKVDA